MPFSACVFEDKKFSNFFPLSLSQPVFELRIGVQNLRLRILDELEIHGSSVLCRKYLSSTLRLRYPELNINALPSPNAKEENSRKTEQVLFINGRLLCYGDELEKLIEKIAPGSIGIKGGYVVAALLPIDAAEDLANYIKRRISEETIAKLCEELKNYGEIPVGKSGTKTKHKLLIPEEPDEGTYEDDHQVGQDSFVEKLPRELNAIVEKHNLSLVDMAGARLISFPWQIIEENSRVIEDDFLKSPFRGQAEESVVYNGVQLVGEENIVIGEAAVIKPGVVLDASTGPIIIGDGTMVMANAALTGPVYVGKQALIKPGAKILEGTSIGDVCKIGGEVDNSTFAAFSNKQHEGFIGHSYIGEWVNIGAGTNNSDLKNNYSPVRMWSAGYVRETGRQFLGLMMGDHTKTGINTMFNTGTVIGFNCNIFGSEPPGKFVPSFSWGMSGQFNVYDLEKGMQTAAVVMERRNIKFEKAHIELFRKIFEISQSTGRNT